MYKRRSIGAKYFCGVIVQTNFNDLSMKYLNVALFSLIFSLVSQIATAQTVDSTKNVTNFSGSVGITNNGFSIIPSFSLNSPAVITNLSWRKKRLSFEPDIRLVPNASKGGILLWLRYKVVDSKKFGLRVGVHPAFNLIRREDTEPGVTKEITEMLRFGAFEIVPSYQFSKRFGVSAVYLQGHAFQKWGPQFTNVLFLNTAFTDLGLSKNVRLSLFPSVFFLHTDGYRGDYFTLTTVLAHKKSPFSLSSTINQTFKADLPGNKAFMWNVGVSYNFSKNLKKLN